MTPKRISLPCAPHFTKPGTYINTHDWANAKGDDTVENRDQTWTARAVSRGTNRRGSRTRHGVFAFPHRFRCSSGIPNCVSGVRLSCDDCVGLIQVELMIVYKGARQRDSSRAVCLVSVVLYRVYRHVSVVGDELCVRCGVDVATADDAAYGAVLKAFGLAEHRCDAERAGRLYLQICASK